MVPNMGRPKTFFGSTHGDQQLCFWYLVYIRPGKHLSRWVDGWSGGWVVGWVAGSTKNIANSAQLKLLLGLILAKVFYFYNSRRLKAIFFASIFLELTNQQLSFIPECSHFRCKGLGLFQRWGWIGEVNLVNKKAKIKS